MILISVGSYTFPSACGGDEGGVKKTASVLNSAPPFNSPRKRGEGQL